MVPDNTVVHVNSSPESLSPLPELLEDDSSVNLSVDVSLDSGRAETASLTQDTEMESVAPSRENPEEVSPDQTTDGKYDSFEHKTIKIFVCISGAWVSKPLHNILS